MTDADQFYLGFREAGAKVESCGGSPEVLRRLADLVDRPDEPYSQGAAAALRWYADDLEAPVQ